MAQNPHPLFYGLDIGSTTAKIAILDRDLRLLFEARMRTLGRPLEATLSLLEEVPQGIRPEPGNAPMTLTGTGGKLLNGIIGGLFVNEIVAHTEAAIHYFPRARSLLDMGGQDTKLVLFSSPKNGRPGIEDFALNSLCAAGTGSFLDQQAARLGLTIEELGRLALLSKNPATLAGRCTVFAKSDMIHLQQAAVPSHDIVAGLSLALARNIKATLARGKRVQPPMIFQGGVAENLGVRKALCKVFGIPEDELFIPEHFRTMGAIGSILYSIRKGVIVNDFKGLDSLRDYIAKRPLRVKRLRPLRLSRMHAHSSGTGEAGSRQKVPPSIGPVRIAIGIDVGSISTKMVAIDLHGRIMARYYGKTGGRPLDAIKTGLGYIKKGLSSPFEVYAVGTTGSGRFLAADFVGADHVINEITAQARAACEIDPDVDTIFEIGGQDSKYIRLEGGVVKDFMMNRACAAGTGSFLEEQAGRLGIDITEFGPLALSARSPVKMGERCTVFMESDLVHYLQQGVGIPDLVAGLSYSIVHNYLNKVVEGRPVGRKIFYQGATALNQGIVAAFENVLGREVNVPEDCGLTGALGAALIARDRQHDSVTCFRGLEYTDIPYKIKTFECHSCPNQCSISRVSIEGRSPIFYGGRCEKYEVGAKRHRGSGLPDLVAERQRLLVSYCCSTVEEANAFPKGAMGIPFSLVMQEWLPFFATFLRVLGYGPVISGATTRALIKKGIESMVTEPCFPVKVAHGHVRAILDMGIKRIFVPSIVDLPGNDGIPGQTCPYVQSIPYTIEAAFNFKAEGCTLYSFPLRARDFKAPNWKKCFEIGKVLRVNPSRVKDAIRRGLSAQNAFRQALLERGEELLRGLGEEGKAVVLVGRPYNALDPGSNLGIHTKLLRLGILPLPIDCLPIHKYLEYAHEIPGMKSMYWRYGQKILAAAAIVARDPRLKAVYCTNFGCGPDSFLLRFFHEIMGEKPFLELEIDEHTADAGIITRIEAFLDTSSSRTEREWPLKGNGLPVRTGMGDQGKTFDRTLYIPYMSNHAYAIAAAFNACGRNAEVLPETDEESASLGLKYTSGKECYPAILTTGDLVKMTMLPGFSPEKAAFFMPCGQGPCRFGQYPRLHRIVLDKLGMNNVPIVSFDQDEGLYEEVSDIGHRFSRIAWQGVVAVDLLDELSRSLRPYARVPEDVDRLYKESLALICDTLRTRGDIIPILKKIKERFKRLPRVSSSKRPTIGIVGEIYVRSNPQANANLIYELERLGAEVKVPTVCEWILYANYTAMRKAKRRGAWRRYAGLLFENMVQILDLRRLENAISPLTHDREPLTGRLFRLARPYMNNEFEGEAILSVGKGVSFIQQGVQGVINVMPFTCMPGTIVNALFARIRERMGRFPFLAISCDGQQETGRALRLEAFMHQVMEEAVR